MATADEILLSAGEERDVQPDVLVVDNDLRTITIPEGTKILGVEGDDDVKRLRFKMPRTYGEFDLGVFAVHIVYVNANNEPDMYLVTDAQRGVDEITFSWLVGENALKYKGETKFAVHLRRVEGGRVAQRFNTEPTEIKVLEGLDANIPPEAAEKAFDIIAQLIGMLDDKANAQIADINAAGAAQKAAIEAKGKATLETIPADYKKMVDDVNQLKDTIDGLIDPFKTTSGRIVKIVSDESDGVIVKSEAEVIHAGRNLFEVGRSKDDYIKNAFLTAVDPLSQTILMQVENGSAAYAIRNIKIPFRNGMSISVTTECIDNDINVAVPMLRMESSDGTILTSGCNGVYNSYYTGFIPLNHNDVPPPVSYTFTCNDDSVAYCCVGVILKSDKGIENGKEVTIRVMAEMGNSTEMWEPGFLRSYTPVSGFVNIQTIQGVNTIYASDQSEIIVTFGTSQIVHSINNKRGNVVLTAKDVGAVSASKICEIVYNTIADMLHDEELPIGKCARTLGYYSVGDGGAARYTVDDTDNGYGLACVNGYCNIVGETYMSPKMFGAVANGDYWNTNDTYAFQTCLDFCAGRYIVNVANGRYVVSGVKLYDGNTYEIVGANQLQRPTDVKSAGCIVVKYPQNVAAFVGVGETGINSATGMPKVKLILRDVQVESYFMDGVGFPTFIKDVWLTNSRIDNVFVNHIGCFIDGIMDGFTTVSNCIIHVSDCAFRSNRIVDDKPLNGFVDCAFYSNFFQGISKFSSLKFKPILFDAYGFYTTQFSSNFIGGFWAIVGCRTLPSSADASFLGWWSRDNVYSFVAQFATKLNDGGKIVIADGKFFGDQIWNCSKQSLVDSAEGQMWFNDLDGNTLIEGDKTTFFNFDIINTGTFRDIVTRFCDPLFPEVMMIYKCTITNPVYLFTPYNDGDYDIGDFSDSEHLFDTKFPLSDFNFYRDTRYKYTYIEPWNNRVVDALPVIQDENYRYVLEGQTCYYNNKLLTCRGDNWYDAMGNVVTS